MDSTKSVKILYCWKSPNRGHWAFIFHQLRYIIRSGRKIVAKTQALKGHPGDTGGFFPLPHLPLHQPHQLSRTRADRIKCLEFPSTPGPCGIWTSASYIVTWTLNLKCQNIPQGRGRTSPWYPQISFPYSFWELWKKILLLLSKILFLCSCGNSQREYYI